MRVAVRMIPVCVVRLVGLVDTNVVTADRLVQLVVDELDPPAQGVKGVGGTTILAGVRSEPEASAPGLRGGHSDSPGLMDNRKP